MSVLSEDLLVNKTIFETIKDFHITCDICLGILMNPKQCSVCETTFCEDCINSWTNKHNSCPMRCNSFKIVDPPRVLKNMLGKLEFKCTDCSKNFSYDKFCSHTKDCKGSDSNSNSSKCPVCSNSQIAPSDLEKYNAKIIEPYEKEILKLQNEIKSYKEIIAVMNEEMNSNTSGSNSNSKSNLNSSKLNPVVVNPPLNNSLLNCVVRPSSIKWPKTQKKFDFTLTDNDKKMIVNYNSCWNIHVADTTFNKNVDEVFKLRVFTAEGGKLEHHYMGFLNSSYINDCLCLYKPNAWYLHNSGDNFKEMNKVKFSNIKMSMEVGIPKIYQFTVNGSTGKVIISGESGEVYGSTFMTGKDFVFFVSKCNGGTFEYTFV